MKKYVLSILDSLSGTRELELLMPNRQALQQRIESEGWVVLNVRATRHSPAKIDDESLILLCQHLQLILDAGLPLYEALSALAQESESQAMASLCRESADRIEHGESLSSALGQAKLDHFFLAMIRTGEKTGQLPELLARAASHLQWRSDMRRQVLSSLSYPLLVLGSLLLVIPLLFIYLVPQLMGFLVAQSAELPWYTVLLIDISEFSQEHGIEIFVGVLLTATVLTAMWRWVEPFRQLLDRIQFKLPLIGPLTLQLNTAQLSEQLGVMYGAGIPVADALPLAAGSLRNSYLRSRISVASQRLASGEGLHQALSCDVLPALLLRMVKVGEMSGKLDTTLAQAAKLYGRQAHRRADKLAAVVGPTVLLFAGGLIIWLVAALILPLYDSLFSMGAGM